MIDGILYEIEQYYQKRNAREVFVQNFKSYNYGSNS